MGMGMMTFDRWMRSGLALASPLIVASCAGGNPPAPAPSRPALPFYVGAGSGSEHGNYGSYPQGEMTMPDGRRCITYVWDRPIDANFALRLRSASCPDTVDPEHWRAMELERTIIPLTASEIVQHDQ